MLDLANGELVINTSTSLTEEARTIIAKLEARISEFARTGMQKMEKSTKLQLQRVVTDAALQTRNMRLIRSYGSFSNVFLSNFDNEGMPMELLPGNSIWKESKLSKWVGNIPDTVLQNIPDGLASKAVIFEQQKDPIIAIPLKGFQTRRFCFSDDITFYAAIFQWE